MSKRVLFDGNVRLGRWLPRSVCAYIRNEKARIRRERLPATEEKRQIKMLIDRHIVRVQASDAMPPLFLRRLDRQTPEGSSL